MPTYSPEPTKRQAQVLDIITASVEERGFPPSLREIGAQLGIEGTRAIEKHVAALEKKGLLKKEHGARALTLPARPMGRAVPIVGQVAAGTPILAAENIEGHLTLDTGLARWDQCFLLRVKGQSMKDAGILDGDLVLVKKQADADNGEIVVALFNDEATVKRLIKKPGHVVLQPENPDFRPIVVRDNEAHIVGKVAGVFRF